MSDTNTNPDQLRMDYKAAVDAWVAAIRAEEELATPDHSIRSTEKWDAAHFREQDAQQRATETRERYQDMLRRSDYGI